MKTFKKVLASTLAAAMVVTALPVTPANAAAAPDPSIIDANTVPVAKSKKLFFRKSENPVKYVSVIVSNTDKPLNIAKIATHINVPTTGLNLR